MFYLYHANNFTFAEFEDSLLIGRNSGELTCPQDNRLSGKHAQITVELKDGQPTIYIEDLGSKNRTVVNRAEIPPHQKIQINLFSFIEVGAQRLVLVDSKAVNVQLVNEAIENYQKKQITKLEDLIAEEAPPAVEEINPYDDIKLKEESLAALQKQISDLETITRAEIQKLEEEKARLINEARGQRAELAKQASTLKMEIEDAKTHLEKVRSEIEQRKKKIINLKDIPSD